MACPYRLANVEADGRSAQQTLYNGGRTHEHDYA
jgi:hypothetical protein